MIDYKVPRQRTVEIGGHIDGVGVVLDPDNEVMASLMESIGGQTKQIDDSIRATTAQIARSTGEIQ